MPTQEKRTPRPDRAELRAGGMTVEEFGALPAPEPLDFVAASGWDHSVVLRMLNNGTLPGRKIGRRWVVNKKAALAILRGEPEA